MIGLGTFFLFTVVLCGLAFIAFHAGMRIAEWVSGDK